MAVPFYVPNNESGSTTSHQSGARTNGSNAVGPVNINPNINDLRQNNDPLLGALAEALYRVLLARQTYGANYYFNLPPPPSPTCSPHLPNYTGGPIAEVFFPTTGVLPLDTSSPSAPHSPTLYHQQAPGLNQVDGMDVVLDSRSAARRTLDGAGSSTSSTLHSPDGQELDASTTREYYDRLKIFEGQVPASRKNKIKRGSAGDEQRSVDVVDTDNAKENLTWPFLTAVLVAVGCGILKATR